MTKALFPGSFNPIHKSHLQIIEYASKAYDELYIFVANNSAKKYKNSTAERAVLVETAVADLGLQNIKVIVQESISMLTPSLAKELGIETIVRGVKGRETKLPDFEARLADDYLEENIDLEFDYIFTGEDISSTMVKDRIENHKDIGDIVPISIHDEVLRMYSNKEIFTKTIQPGKVVLFTGPSGVGKGTLRNLFQDIKKLELEFSVSATTRPIRETEVDGVDYFFLTREEFEVQIKNNQFAEWAEYAGNYYGTPLSSLKQIIRTGRNVLLEIEAQGALQIFDNFEEDEIISIFIAPPSLQILKKRLEARGTETAEAIEKRLIAVENEMETSDRFKYVVINDDKQVAANEIEEIIIGEIYGQV